MADRIPTVIENTNEIYNYIKELDFKPVTGIELSRDERIILNDIFYDHISKNLFEHRFFDNHRGNTAYFVNESIKAEIRNKTGKIDFGDFSDEEKHLIYSKVTKENINELLKKVVEQLTEEEKRVIIKCGVELDQIFIPHYYDTHISVDINEKISLIIDNTCKIEFGDYYIQRTQERPLNRDDKKILKYREEYQEEMYQKAKDGLNCYKIRKKDADEYSYQFMYIEFIGFPDYARVGDIAIFGDYGLCGPRDTSYGIENNYDYIMETIRKIKTNIKFNDKKDSDTPKTLFLTK